MLRTTLVFGLIALAAPTMAGELSYNYFNAGWQKIDLDDGTFSIDGDGFGIGGSVEIGDSFHLFGAYASSDFDFGVDLDQYELGIGYHMPMSNNVHGIFELSYISAEAEALGISVDEDGYGATVGVRALLGERLELGAGVNYVDLGDSDDTTFGGSAWYQATRSFAFGVNADWGDDVTSYGAAVRLYFGN